MSARFTLYNKSYSKNGFFAVALVTLGLVGVIVRFYKSEYSGIALPIGGFLLGVFVLCRLSEPLVRDNKSKNEKL